VKVSTQVGVGLLVAGILVAVLQWYVAVVAEEDEATVLPASKVDRVPPPDHGAEGRDLLEDLRGEACGFHLATNREALPAGCAPVVSVLVGGTIVVSVAPPLVMRPGPLVWDRVGILLPQARISDLSASERSSLIAIWSRLRGGGVLAADRIHVHGCHFQPGELEVLLRWLR
jgi:hypothetical protein